MNMTELEIAYRELEDSLIGSGPEEEGIARRGFAERIAREIKEQPESADLHHKYGLCLYEIPNWSEDDIRRIEIAFKKAIELDNEAVFSRIFLTYFFYDNQRYSESLAVNCVSECQGNARVPMWRTCNMLELQLCSQLVLGENSIAELEVGLKQLQELVSSVEDDVADVAWPIELCNVIKRDRKLLEEIDGSRIAWLNIV